MREQKIVLASVFLLLSAMMVIPASAQQKPLSGGTLRAALNWDPLSVNGIVKFWSPVGIVDAFIFDTLVAFDQNYRPAGDLAKSWTFSSDSKSITFQLRDDVWWSDGVKFTSADVKWHYLMLMNGTSVTKARLKGLMSIDAPTDSTITFSFSTSRNQLLLLIPFGLWSTSVDQRILPKHTYRWGTNYNFTDNPANSGVGMPTTGPFIITQYKQGQGMTFERNQLYGHKSFPDRHPAYLDKIIFQFITDPTTAIAAVQNGQVDMVHEGTYAVVSPQDLPRVSKLPGLSLSGKPYYTTWRMTFNFGNATKQYPWVKDLRVRQAFAYGINKQSMIHTLLLDITTSADGPISDLIKDWYNPDITKYTYDPVKAEQLLDDAGYKKDASGVRIRAPVLSYASGTIFGESIKSDLQKIGIILDVRPIDETTFSSVYEIGPTGLNPYPLGLQTFGGGPFPFNVDAQLSAKFASPNGQNCGFYNNSRVNELIDLASNENDVSKLKAYYNEEQAIVSKDLPAIYLFNHVKINVWNSDYKGVVESMTPEPSWFTHGLNEVWWTKAPQQTALTTQTAQATSGGGMDTSAVGAVVAVLIIIVVATLLMRRRRK